MNKLEVLKNICQERFGAGIETQVVAVSGKLPRDRKVTVEISIPNGKVYKATVSCPKFRAEQAAADKALVDLGYTEEELKEV